MPSPSPETLANNMVNLTGQLIAAKDDYTALNDGQKAGLTNALAALVLAVEAIVPKPVPAPVPIPEPEHPHLAARDSASGRFSAEHPKRT